MTTQGSPAVSALPLSISPCPVCGSDNADLLYTVTAEEAAQHFVLREGDAERHRQLVAQIERLWQGNTCSIRRCSGCGFGFSDPYVAGDAKFYQLAFERAGYPSDKWEYQRTLRALDALQFQGRRVLEVGAGFGLFLDKIAGKRVPREGVTALEYSEKALDVLRGKGYTAIPEDVRSATLEPGFDAIFLFQVVEHMDGLAALFARLSHLLAPGGRVFIAVPNSKKTDFQEASGSMLDMPPNHIGRWCPSALESIVAGTGLHIEAVETQPFFIRDFIKEDIAYSYGRKCQRSGTLMNWSRSVRTKKGGKLVGMAFALAAAPLRIPVWLRAAAVSRDIGGSLWIELTKGIGPQPV